jgi:hypothetical protein
VSRGAAALPAALVAVAVGAALGAAVAELTRVEIIVAQRRRAAITALLADDACLAEAIATLPPDWDFAAVLAGPDGIAGSADDGLVVAPAGCSVRARPAPRPPLPPRVLLHVEADAGGGHRALDAVVGLDRAPGLQAVLWLDRPPTADTVGGTLVLDGVGGESGPGIAAFAAPDEPDALDRWVAAAGDHVATTTGTAPPIAGAPPPLAGILARIGGASPRGLDALVPGVPVPTAALVAGDVVLDTPRRGAGILFVDGTLDIASAFDFTGLVVVSRGVRVRSGATFTVRGALWLGSPAAPAATLAVDGVTVLTHDTAALADADARVPLPRAPVLLGIRDLG